MITNLPPLITEPLSTETLWAILNNDLPDDTVNQLVWYNLGYRYIAPDIAPENIDSKTDPAATGASQAIPQHWHATAVDAKWQEKYPQPPNFIDSRPATVQLTRSIPQENKQLLKTLLGFKGYSVDQLVPRLTRRATMANWLLSEMRLRGLI